MDKLTGSASPRAVSFHALLRRRETEESECVCIDEGQDTYLPQIAGAAIARFFLFFFFLRSTLYCISWVGGKKAEPDAESSYTLI